MIGEYRSHCCLVNTHAGGQQAAVTQLPEAKQRRADVPLKCLEMSLVPFPCTNQMPVERAALHLDYHIAMQKAAEDIFMGKPNSLQVGADTPSGCRQRTAAANTTSHTIASHYCVPIK